jgi:hypothetical protein
MVPVERLAQAPPGGEAPRATQLIARQRTTAVSAAAGPFDFVVCLDKKMALLKLVGGVADD